jgi:nitroreductase
MLLDLIKKNRSYRRFDASHAVDETTLRDLVDLARLSPSAGNVQPLKFLLSCDPERNAAIFPCLAWAGFLKNWPGPAAGERPTAYIVILGDREIAAGFDVNHGIAAQSILLGAVEKGLGGCMIGAVNREELRRVLALRERYDILLVVALGKPAEEIVLEDVEAGADMRYYRDEGDAHHVPKRKLEELLVKPG